MARTVKIITDPYNPHRQLIRMSWNKYNLYNLLTRTKPQDLSRLSVYQQKWIAKREIRGYHVPYIKERQLIDRHWSPTLPLQQMTRAEKERVPPMQALAFSETERRVDVVVFRSHFAENIFKAKRLVVGGLVRVNGKKCTEPAARLADGDMVTVAPHVIPTLTGEKKSDKPLEFKAVPYMAPWMFIPEYLEVDYDTCSTVFLRSPLPQPDRVEIPSPFPPEWHQLVYGWYARILRQKRLYNKPNEDLMPPIVIEGQTIRLKKKFAEIRRREDKERKAKMHELKEERLKRARLEMDEAERMAAAGAAEQPQA
ncbi:mitochondrial 37S ribosomal protein nam9 [Borealophlyctis nickersoniae]|nr:mitochondrial 37S ribosomal protein nam9 [Borealophlyctis nickersoniae]